MNRRVIDAAELLARLAQRPRPRKNGITPELRTAIVLRALGGEDPEHLALEVGRSAATVRAWCSYYRVRNSYPEHMYARLFVKQARGHLAAMDGGA